MPEDTAPVPVARGGYVAADGNDAVIVASGSELPLALEVREVLAAQGRAIRVVSLPCWEAFAEQDAAYRTEVLGVGLPVASLEAAVTYGWAAITGREGLNIGIDGFGASAPAAVLADEYGFTPAAVASRVADWLATL